jgi:hypothetical protein
MTVNVTPTYRVDDFLRDLKEPYAWPGGYPRYFVCADGEPLCFACADKEQANVTSGIDTHDGLWEAVGCEINWDSDLTCANCAQPIQRAYPDD